jgi:hypothetical protein
MPEENPIDLSQFPDRQNKNEIVKQTMQVLSQSEDAAYTVYLLLCKRFGAGQKQFGSVREVV